MLTNFWYSLLVRALALLFVSCQASTISVNVPCKQSVKRKLIQIILKKKNKKGRLFIVLARGRAAYQNGKRSALCAAFKRNLALIEISSGPQTSFELMARKLLQIPQPTELIINRLWQRRRGPPTCPQASQQGKWRATGNGGEGGRQKCANTHTHTHFKCKCTAVGNWQRPQFTLDYKCSLARRGEGEWAKTRQRWHKIQEPKCIYTYMLCA